MGISSRNPDLYIGFSSSYINGFFTSSKFEFSLVASIIVLWLCLKRVLETGVLIGCVEMSLRDRGIDRLCMRCISEIGVLICVRATPPLRSQYTILRLPKAS